MSVLYVAGFFGPVALLLAAFRWRGAWKVWAILPSLFWLVYLLLWYEPQGTHANVHHERWLFPAEFFFICGVGIYVLALAIWHHRVLRR
jgi:hypothetical protein